MVPEESSIAIFKMGKIMRFKEQTEFVKVGKETKQRWKQASYVQRGEMVLPTVASVKKAGGRPYQSGYQMPGSVTELYPVVNMK